MSTVPVAVVQAGSILFDTEATVAEAERLIGECAGARLVVFPEAFVSAYPKGLDFGAVVGRRTREGRDHFRRYFESAIAGAEPVASTFFGERYIAAQSESDSFAEGEGAMWAIAWTPEGELVTESYVNMIPTRHGGFVFETEVLLAAAARGWMVREVPVRALPRVAARSRFRPVVDGVAIGAHLGERTLVRAARESVAAARELVALASASRARERHAVMLEGAAPYAGGIAWGVWYTPICPARRKPNGGWRASPSPACPRPRASREH